MFFADKSIIKVKKLRWQKIQIVEILKVINKVSPEYSGVGFGFFFHQCFLLLKFLMNYLNWALPGRLEVPPLLPGLEGHL